MGAHQGALPLHHHPVRRRVQQPLPLIPDRPPWGGQGLEGGALRSCSGLMGEEGGPAQSKGGMIHAEVFSCQNKIIQKRTDSSYDAFSAVTRSCPRRNAPCLLNLQKLRAAQN